jgi:hypothetical protein
MMPFFNRDADRPVEGTISMRTKAFTVVGPLALACAFTLVASGLRAQEERTLQSSTSDIVCTLVVDPSSAEYPATVSVANTSEHGVKLYKVFLPRDGLSLVDMFIVQRDGVRQQYKGAWAKLPGKPSDDDFVSLAPGGRISATIPLRQNYDAALPGRYSVKYSIAHPQPGGGFLGGSLEVVSNELSFTVQQQRAKTPLTRDQAIAVASKAAEGRTGDLTPYEIHVKEAKRVWQIDFELKKKGANGGRFTTELARPQERSSGSNTNSNLLEPRGWLLVHLHKVAAG